MTRPAISCISPSFIVQNVTAATSFYRDMPGFEIMYQHPDDDPFFAIVCRDGVMIFVKSVGEGPVPDCKRHLYARLGAYVSVHDPDALAAQFTSGGVTFSAPLKDTSDGLRGFELKDAGGYVLFFGWPRENSN
jgi:catechol 2,3-dioxygenase-like lactoylglutathione lyase family enzyme